jgi:hypothetical protein
MKLFEFKRIKPPEWTSCMEVHAAVSTAHLCLKVGGCNQKSVGKKLNMGLAATKLPDLHCALWPNFENTEILNHSDLDRPQNLIQAQ